MNKLILLLLASLTVTTCFGQTIDTYEPFNNLDYPVGKYIIKLDTAVFYQFKIEIRQVNSKWDSSSFYCRSWLIVKKGNKVIRKRFFKSIDPVGGCSGLFIPNTQPRKDFFILSKFGDYDGIIFILDTTGKLIENPGGDFFMSKDKRYLFSNYNSDAGGLTVYDLTKRLLLYSVIDDIPNSLGAWYYQNGKYFARAYDNDENDEGQQIKIATFDFKTNQLVITTVDRSFVKEKNKLRANNDYQYARECSCGN